MSDQNNDLIVRPNEYAYILDQTKGQITIYVGPTKASLSQTDVPVRLDTSDRGRGKPPEWIECPRKDAIQQFTNVPEGWYCVLKNPSADGGHPNEGTNTTSPSLKTCIKEVIAGPSTFALYPGQMAKVLRGHRLRNNQYLVCRVYNEDAALESRGTTILKGSEGGDSNPEAENDNGQQTAPDQRELFPGKLTQGKLFIIKGTEVSFFIPPTGIEVVPSEDGSYVRDAITLEQLEYCILLEQSGSKRFEHGPAVVFPTATETFVKNGDTRKFRAIELNPQIGLYIKVTADYTDEDGNEHRQGDELFLTGERTKIYYPRSEHVVIQQGDSFTLHSVAIPAGEGRYVLDKNTGEVELVKGPRMFLPDPRTQVIVRRVLTESQCNLWFPGNNAAVRHNRNLSQLNDDSSTPVSEELVTSSRGLGRSNRLSSDSELGLMASSVSYSGVKGATAESFGNDAWSQEQAGTSFAGDKVERKTSYTPPRMITIDSKFDGAVRIAVRSGYAVNIVSKGGERRVVEGPRTTLLAYDEDLEPFNLSTGKPKGEGGTKIKQDVYLRVHGNKVSDIIRVTTKDLVDISVRLSYRCTFRNTKKDMWFAVENYTKLLCEHLGSKIRNKIKHYDTRTVNAEGIDIVRECVLGSGRVDEEGKSHERPGFTFEENGLHVYDVEVFGIEVTDSTIARQIHEAQEETVSLELQVNSERAKLANAEALAQIRMRRAQIERETGLAELTAKEEVAEVRAKHKLAEASRDLETIKVEVLSNGAKEEARLKVDRERFALVEDRLKAETAAYVARMEAIDPDLSAKVQLLSDRMFASAQLKELGAHALLRGESIADVLAKVVNGAPGLESLTRAIPTQVNVDKALTDGPESPPPAE